jgi:putative ABC transport system substrate-binding protein
MPSFEAAARSLKVALIAAPVHSDAEIEAAIVALGREPGGGLVVIADTFMFVSCMLIHIFESAATRCGVGSGR